MKTYLKNRLRGCKNIHMLRDEASLRSFFRVFYDSSVMVAMVYPQASEGEIKRIVKLSSLYQTHNIPVPQILDVLDNRIVLQEDLGDQLVQTYFNSANKEEKINVLQLVQSLLLKLGNIPISATPFHLDHKRMKWEMDFFITHFAQPFLPEETNQNDLKKVLNQLVDSIHMEDTFAHRDFHSRNMLLHNHQVYLVDLQDSLRAPRYYDLVSFIYDSYLDLKSERDMVLRNLQKAGLELDQQQIYLTALQRNIKALGTFGNQITIRRNLSYKKYIRRTIQHIKSNPLYSTFFNHSLFEKIYV